MKFVREGAQALALDPQARGVDYSYTSAPQDAPVIIGETAIIHVRGPLSHHAEWWFESYDEIVRRAEIAYLGCPEAKSVLWLGDSPGGDVSGCFASSRMLLRMKEQSGKRSAWYADGMTCSAAVALAMHCDEIYVPPEARFGSIGVIAELHSYAKLARAHGEDFALVTSGEYKADGHPYADIDAKMLARVQESVEYEAGLFYEWVAERTSVSVDTIKSWKAGVFHGQQAIDAGLADAVTDDEGALELVSRAADNESEDDYARTG